MIKIIKNEPFSDDMYIDFNCVNCEIEVVKLCTRTDVHNNVLAKKSITPLKGEAIADGKIFFVKNHIIKETMIIVSLSPDMANSKIQLKDYRIKVEHCNYPVACGKCRLGEEEKELRSFFAERMKSKDIFIMVNNWGDCNCGENIGYDFYFKEIERASEIGVDVVQIDDGWQCGSPAKTRIYTDDGEYTFYHNFYDGFWEVDEKKFPNGLKPLVDYAKAKNVKLGLWFAPDSMNNFKNMQRDIEVLKKAYDEGFRYFKLDMVVIKSFVDSQKFLKMLETVSKFGDDVYLQIDVTGDIERLGFLCGFEYGKIFVENRSCKFREYYPHTTLKNLWKLAQYMPAQLFQFEVPNRKHFSEYYREDDVLAPITYETDYLFASVMVSNPLLWMEVQNLSDDDKFKIKNIADVWKRHRDELKCTDVIPIGKEPNGSTLTGFLCMGETYGYIVALREACEENEFKIQPQCGVNNIEVLASSENVGVSVENNTVSITFDNMRQYAFCRFEKC